MTNPKIEYERYLSQGMTPEEALQKMAETYENDNPQRITAYVQFLYENGQIREMYGNMHPEYFRAMADAMEIVFKKNADYSTEEDPFRNFRESEGFGVPAHYAVMVRLSDKWSRLKNYFVNGEYQVKDEGVRDTIVDMINYLAILAAMLEDERKRGDKND